MKNNKVEKMDLNDTARLITNTMNRNLTAVQEVLDLDLDELIQIIERCFE